MNSATRGFKFMPTIQETLSYLKKKLMGEPLPWDGIQEKDLYGKEPPWELFKENAPWVKIDDDDDYVSSSKKIKKEFIYCFTRLKKVHRNSTERRLRTSECGRWHQGTKAKKSRNGWIMKVFTFKKWAGLSFDGDAANDKWTMIEYSLSREILKEMNAQFTDYVICKVTRHVRKSVSKNQDTMPRPCLNLQGGSSEETVSDWDLNRQESRIGMNGEETEVESALTEESTCGKKNEDCVPADEPQTSSLPCW